MPVSFHDHVPPKAHAGVALSLDTSRMFANEKKAEVKTSSKGPHTPHQPIQPRASYLIARASTVAGFKESQNFRLSSVVEVPADSPSSRGSQGGDGVRRCCS